MKRESKKIAYKLFGSYLEKGENIRYILRTHPIIMHTEMAKIKFLFLLLPALMWYFIPAAKYFAIILISLGVLKLFITLINWYYNTWLITNRAIISIGGSRFWSLSTTRIEYHMIEGITCHINGFWHSMFDFGTITLEKVGGGQTIVTLNEAYKPHRAEQEILQCQKSYLKDRYRDDHNELKQLLHQMVKEYAGA